MQKTGTCEAPEVRNLTPRELDGDNGFDFDFNSNLILFTQKLLKEDSNLYLKTFFLT